MSTPTEYGIRLDGRIIVGPDWRSIAEVMAASHGYGTQVGGDLVKRTGDGPWEQVGQ